MSLSPTDPANTIVLGRLRLRRASPPPSWMMFAAPLRYRQRKRDYPQEIIVERIYAPPDRPVRYSRIAVIPRALGHIEAPGIHEPVVTVTPDEAWDAMRRQVTAAAA